MSAPTPEQHAAIVARGNVLVVAGAGTGKTHTLIRRCLRLLVEERVPIENLLLVTFTEAAAAEMRERLREALRKALEAQPADEHLARQFALLDTARISTLHSFCLQLVREHFHELGLDPQFTVLDERQTAPLRAAALDAVFDRCYEADDANARAVKQIIRVFGGGRDGIIRKVVERVHDYARSLPDPEAWFNEQEQRFEQPAPDEWRRLWLEAVAAWREEWLEELNQRRADAPALARSWDAIKDWPGEQSLQTASPVLRSVLEADASPDGWPYGTIGKVRKLMEDFFEEAEFLASYLPKDDGSDPLAEDWELARQHALAVLGLTRAFAEEFAARKRELAGLDFADLEQFALRLLRQRPDGAPSAIARAWRQRLAYVLVDEYQDINGAQDAIIAALSRQEEGNRFLVGDVKQSIYRFRRANPKIFAGYRRRWHGGGGRGHVLSLTENFRSREAILNFVNALFSVLMQESVCGVDYEPIEFAKRAERTAFAAGADAEPCVEIHLLPRAGTIEAAEDAGSESADEVSDLTIVEREARLVAHRLRELKESGFEVWDKDQKRFRAVEWQDMAVLLRAPAGRAEAFAREFARAGVPLVAERPGFFSTLEVTDLLNLLRLLDNPLQDIPVAAVLRSPLVGLSADELAQIRAGSESPRFWTALEEFAGARGSDSRADATAGEPDAARAALQRKAAAFLEQFRRWRELLRHVSLSQCLETVLAETHYEALLHTQERGAERALNVRRLLDLARQFDPYQRQGLYRFLRFVEGQQDGEMDLDAPPPLSTKAVQLMSIHKAKGLEFPVVVLACMGTGFNVQDLHGPILLHETLGLCSRIRRSVEEQSYPGLTWWLARRLERRELLGEEMRLLYVALTRARDRLILVGSASARGGERAWLNEVRAEDTPRSRDASVSEDALLRARSHLAWLMPWLPYAVRQHGGVQGETTGKNKLFAWHIHSEDDPVFRSPKPERAAPAAEDSSPDAVARIEDLRARLQWQYPFVKATQRIAKASVSELRRRALEETDEEARWLFRHRSRLLSGSFRRDVADAAALSPAEVGAAHHRFLQRLDLERAGDAAALAAEAQRLAREGHLSAAEAAALDLEAVAAFWNSEQGRRIRAVPQRVRRELAFTARFAPEELDGLLGLAARGAPGGEEGEFVVVQGVADLVVVQPGELWLVDFKTDAVTPQTLEETARRYLPQMRLYARALERIYRRPVRECALHFLALRRSVPVAPG